MAEATGLRNNALPYPVYAAPWGIVVPILDADGDLVTGASSLDSEVSKNGDTFADCTNEATEIATSSGYYYLLLTATELTADVVAGIIKTGTAGAKTTPFTLYPKKLPAIRSGTAQGGASGSITLDSGASAIDDFYNGCLVVGTLDGAVEARIITDYNGSTKAASVTPNWNTTPDSDDTFIVYLPDGVQVPTVNVTHAAEVAWASGAITAAVIATGAVDADAIADNAIDAGAIASNAITDAKIASNAITAAKIADGAIDAATFAADVDAEILSYLVDDATRIDASALNTATGTTIPAIDAKTDNLPTDPADQSAVEAAITSALTTAIADSIPADGSRPSIAQALYMLTQFMVEREVSGTTMTIKKPDGSTTLFTITLNDATTPTSLTRAT